jgi:hypothetical protein
MRSPCRLCLRIPAIFLVFYAVRVISKEIRPLVLHRTTCYKSFLPKTTPELRELFGSDMYKILFYPVRLPRRRTDAYRITYQSKKKNYCFSSCILCLGVGVKSERENTGKHGSRIRKKTLCMCLCIRQI